MNSVNKLKETMYNAVEGDISFKKQWSSAVDTLVDSSILKLNTSTTLNLTSGSENLIIFDPIVIPAGWAINDIGYAFLDENLSSLTPFYFYGYTSFDTPLNADTIPFENYRDVSDVADNSSWTPEQKTFLDNQPYLLNYDYYSDNVGDQYDGTDGTNTFMATPIVSSIRQGDMWSGYNAHLNADYSIANDGENVLTSAPHNLYTAFHLDTDYDFVNIKCSVSLEIYPVNP